MRAGEEVLKFLLNLQDPSTLRVSSMVRVIFKAMVFVEGVRGLDGAGRKDAVIYAVKRLATEHTEGDLRGALLEFADVALPTVIDELVYISKSPSVFGGKSGGTCCPKLK